MWPWRNTSTGSGASSTGLSSCLRNVPHIKMCGMASNFHLDDKKVDLARKVGNHRTKREAVDSALDAYIRLKRRERLIEMMGTIDFDPDYDYKKERQRKR